MTDEEYIRRELRRAQPASKDDQVLIKMRSSAGESCWVSLPDWVHELIPVMASLSRDESFSLRYAVECLVEDPQYFGNSRTNGDLTAIYNRLHNDTEGDN
jgi:hypothetical protein